MMLDDYAASRFEEACGLLSLRLKNAAMSLPVETKAVVEELRLRIDRPVFLVGPDGETELAETRVLKNDLDQVLDKATDFSRYSAVENIRRGYVTAAGGFRIGICGTALPSGEENRREAEKQRFCGIWCGWSVKAGRYAGPAASHWWTSGGSWPQYIGAGRS